MFTVNNNLITSSAAIVNSEMPAEGLCRLARELFSSLCRAIEQDTEVIRPTICTRVSFVLKFFTILKLFYIH